MQGNYIAFAIHGNGSKIKFIKMGSIMKLIRNIKLKTIALVASALIISVAGIIYLPKLILPKESYQFSKPDGRATEIKGEVITLKRLQHAYFENLFKMCTPKARAPLYFHFPFTIKNYTNYLNKQLSSEAANRTLFYIIFDNNDDKPIGSVEIRAKRTDVPEKDPKNVGQLSCWLNENYWGGGRIREALKLINKEYFRLNDVKNYTAHVEMWNIRSYYALEKAGFTLAETRYYSVFHKPRYILEYINPDYQDKK